MVETPALSFADLLKQYRAAIMLTQEELAERSGLSVRAISDLERGIKHRPYAHTVQRLLQALELQGQAAATFQAAARRIVAASRFEDRATSGWKTVTLPISPTPFIGRQREGEEVKALLTSPEVRLLTLTGPGGVGKTRLTVRVAEEAAGPFPDGIVYVPLVSLADPRLVPSVMATALSIGEGSGPILERLIEHLHDRRLLLLLDNFEHLLSATTAVSHLLAACPEITVLVTSRTVLRLSGEHEYPVRPLALPIRGHLPEPEVLSRYDAMQLFLQRGRAVRPSFQLTAANAATIAEICFRLDGLPLAIELAAARLRLFSPDGLLARLSDRLRILTGGPTDLPAKQQTLRDAIDWSYHLLCPEYQSRLAQLAVFAGGCTPEAAEVICAQPDEPDADVLEGISALVEHSLVRPEDGAAGETRFLLLETIREYAAERLAAQADGAAVRQRHAAYYAALAAEEQACRDDAARRSWCDRMEHEHDNIRAALRWYLACDGEAALQMALHLTDFWYERCHQAEGHRWLVETLAVAGDAPLRLRTRGFRKASRLAFWRGDNSAAEALAEESVRLARELGDDLEMARSLRCLTSPVKDRGEHDRAERIIDESLSLFRACGELAGVMWALHFRGEVALNRGDYTRAAEITVESVALARELGDRRYLVYGLDNLARPLLCLGDVGGATSLWLEGAELAIEYGDRTGGVYYLEGLAGVVAHEERLALAAILAGAADATRREIHEPRSGAEAEIVARFLAPARARLSDASWEVAWGLGQEMTFEEAVAHALSAFRAW